MPLHCLFHSLWYRALARAVAGVYYRRIHVVGREHLPTAPGAVLYVGLHRNGAIDGMIYKRLIPRATFLIAARLLRSRFRRLFFTGIPVTREKDGASDADRRANALALARSVDELVGGRELFVLPEGTSDLGPRHLPFKPGAAKILERALAAGAQVTVVPVAIFYEAPEAFRSEVTVVLGPPVATALAAELPERRRVAVLMMRITAALESLGVNVESVAELSRIETSAAIAVDGDPVDQGRRYHAALKALEHTTPPAHVAEAWSRIVGGMVQRRLATVLGVPAYSRRGVAWNACWLALQAAAVAVATALNTVPLIGAYVAGRRLADARNTVALWRVLVGGPLATIWGCALGMTAAFTGHGWGIGAYAVITVVGLVLYPELRARWAKLRNAYNGSPGRADVRVVQHWVESLIQPTSHVGSPVQVQRSGRRARMGRSAAAPSLLLHV